MVGCKKRIRMECERKIEWRVYMRLIIELSVAGIEL